MKRLSGETCGIELDEMGLGRMIHMPILQTRRLRPRGSQGLPQNHTPELEEVRWLFLAFLRPDTSRLPSLSWAFCLFLNLPQSRPVSPSSFSLDLAPSFSACSASSLLLSASLSTPASSAVSDSVRPHGLEPARLLCPRDFPGKDTGVGCHSLSRGSAQPGDEPECLTSPALAGRFFTTAPPGKPPLCHYLCLYLFKDVDMFLWASCVCVYVSICRSVLLSPSPFPYPPGAPGAGAAGVVAGWGWSQL